MLLVAHGSSDPLFGAVVEAVAARLRLIASGLAVRVGYLEHGPPYVADVAAPGAVAVPLLLAAGYHVRVDLPAQAPGVVVTDALGPDRRLAVVMAERLRAAGYTGGPVTLAAAGSKDPRAIDDVVESAGQLAALLGVAVEPAYLSAASPRLADLAPAAVATYLLAPGAFADAVLACGATVVGAPVGAHPLVADIVLDRYRAALPPRDDQVPGRTAPA